MAMSAEEKSAGGRAEEEEVGGGECLEEEEAAAERGGGEARLGASLSLPSLPLLLLKRLRRASPAEATRLVVGAGRRDGRGTDDCGVCTGCLLCRCAAEPGLGPTSATGRRGGVDCARGVSPDGPAERAARRSRRAWGPGRHRRCSEPATTSTVIWHGTKGGCHTHGGRRVKVVAAVGERDAGGRAGSVCARVLRAAGRRNTLEWLMSPPERPQAPLATGTFGHRGMTRAHRRVRPSLLAARRRWPHVAAR